MKHANASDVSEACEATDSGTKKCTRCHLVLPLSNFHSQRNKCKPCYRKQTKVRTDRHYENEDLSTRLWRRAKCRAKQKRLPFDIEPSDIIIPKTCSLLGVPIEKGKKGKELRKTASIDRIIPELGYVKSNVWVISNRANIIKNDATLEELQTLTKNLAAHMEKTKLPIYSASQINDWQDCPRKWAWSRIDGVPRTTTKAAELGSAVHAQLERHLRGGKLDYLADPIAANLAAAAVPYLPEPGTVEVEHAFTRMGERHGWTGFMDFRQIASGMVLIGDHKTTSNLAYLKTADVLQTDPQAVIYAAETFAEFPYLDVVDLQWTYIQTRGATKVIPVRTQLGRENTLDQFFLLDQIADQIDTARQNVTSAIELPYNSDACHKYGGCPYQSKCNLSPFEQVRTMSMTLLEKMKQAQQTAAAPAPVDGDVYALATKDARGYVTHDLQGRPLPKAIIEAQHTGYIPNPSNGNSYVAIRPLNQHVASYLAYYAENAAHFNANPPTFSGDPPAPAPVTPAAPPAAPAAPTFGNWAPPGLTPPQPINPPESAQASAPAAPAFAPTPVAPTAAPSAPAPVAAPTADAPKKRGRPTNAEKAAREAAAAPSAPTNGTAAPTAPAFTFAAPTPAAATRETTPSPVPDAPAAAPVNDDERPIRTLYIGCRPINPVDTLIEFEEIAAYVHRMVKQDMQVDDYSFVEFGKGAGAVSLYAERFARDNAGVDMIVDMRAREASLVLSRLLPLANLVVRAM